MEKKATTTPVKPPGLGALVEVGEHNYEVLEGLLEGKTPEDVDYVTLTSTLRRSVETRQKLLENEELSAREAFEHAEAFERVVTNAPSIGRRNEMALGTAEVSKERRNLRLSQKDQQRGKWERDKRDASRLRLENRTRMFGKPDKRLGVRGQGRVETRQRKCFVCGKVGHKHNHHKLIHNFYQQTIKN
ncbi:unnamed protein product [Anisakis simplex]|uniref:CCHC-type domain-containing protein n=1 Tax=Anisakis simplex TaxID=6269 RepID=A0A0M3JA85_ANISI|nr:unnamed protein product [Anisakis simplex]